MKKAYRIKFQTGLSNCSTTLEITSLKVFMKSLKDKNWLIIDGEPTMCVNMERVDNISFKEIK